MSVDGPHRDRLRHRCGRRARRAGAGRRPRAGVGAVGRRRGAGGRAAVRRGRPRPGDGLALRCDRVDFEPGRHRLPPHPSRAGDPLPAVRRDHDRQRRAPSTRTAPGEPWFERGPDPVLATTIADGAVGVRPRDAAARGVGGQADDPLRRPGRRREAQDPEGRRSSSRRRCGDDAARGGQILVDQLALHGAELAFGVPGESYLAVLDALHDADLRLVVTPPRGGRGEHGRGVRQAHRPARRLPRDARAGRHARERRRPYGLPGLHADAAARRPGARAARPAGRASRSSTTRRSSGRWPSGRRRSTSAARIPGDDGARVRGGRRRGARGRWSSRCPRTCSRTAADVPDARPHRVPAGAPDAADLARLRELLAGAARPLMIVGEGGWTAQAGADVVAFAEADRAAGGGVVALPGLRGQPLARSTPATPGSAMAPALAERIAERRPADRRRRAAGRDPDERLHAARRARARDSALVHVHPDPGRARRGLPARARHRVGPAAVRRGSRGRSSPRRRRASTALVAEAHARVPAQPAETARELPGGVQLAAVMAHAARAPGRGRDHHVAARATSPCGRTGTTSSRATRPSSPRAAARWATASPRPWRRRRCTPSAPSSASPGTGTS